MKKDIANKYILSITEAAEAFGIGEHRLRELAYSDPTFPKLQIGSHTKINSRLFKDWLDKATIDKKQI